MGGKEILLLSGSEVRTLLDIKDVLQTVEEVFKMLAKGRVIQPIKTTIKDNEMGYRITCLPCLVESIVAGMKWVANNPHNRKRGLPTVTAIVVINDPETTMPISIMDGSVITAMRTAGHAAVAAKYLAKKDSSAVAIIGCGSEGRSHLNAMNELFKIQEVKAYDVSSNAVENYVNEMEERLGLKIQSARSAKDAIKGADIICMVTSSTNPVVLEPWVEPGCFVAATAAFRDLDPRLSNEADKWVLGNLESDFHHASQTTTMKLSKDDVYGDLGEIITGKKLGRAADHERIVFTHGGMGSLDICTALLAYNEAIKKGIGLKVRF